LSAAYLINHIPTPFLSNKSPHELLFSTSPSYSHIRIFGCLAYISTLSRNRTKFDSLAIPYVFIGYPFGIKGYKFFNLHTKFIVVSRDAVFHEHLFPFALNLMHSSSDGCFTTQPSQHSTISLPIPILDFLISLPISTTHSVSSSLTPSASQPSTPQHSALQHSTPQHSALQHPTSPASSSSPIVPSSPLRRSTRIKTQPRYLQQYHCQLASSFPSLPSSTTSNSGIPYSLSSYLSYDKLSPAYKHFCFSISAQSEPTFYHEAVKFSHWRDAMSAEILALEANHTWDVCDIPPNKHPIGCKWVTR
jgi:hypothetical protein